MRSLVLPTVVFLPAMVFVLVGLETGCAVVDPWESRRAELSEGAEDCGRLAPRTECDDSGQQAARCLLDAWSACQRATLETTRTTIEGDPIVGLLAIEPSDDGCRVVQLIDTRADDFGPREVTESVCAQLVEEDAAFRGCPFVVAEDCTRR